jgi:xanthine dehydrogenase accessory factor
MIGSKNKVAQAEKDLIAKNILPKEKIAKIDMPIGIPIKCETPEEIAISILAKLIDVKNQNNG